ncbi:MAG: NAD-binding protein, partial [Longimicrobiales bacterium]
MAGLVLSGSDYAREALGSLLPLRDAFVALFFVTVGMLIDPRTLLSNLPLLATLIVMIVLGKALIWTVVVRLFGYGLWTAVGVALGLTQIGEFSFILVQVARGASLVGNDVYNATLAASLVSILLNAFIWRFGMPLVDQKRATFGLLETGEAPPLEGHIVICGFGRMGGAAGAALDAFQLRYVIVEIDPEVVRSARARNLHCLFGDPSRRAVLEAAHTDSAALVLVTIPEAERAYLTIRNVRTLNAHAPVLARAHRRSEYELLIQAGATKVVQPETEASAMLIGEALEVAGIPEDQVLAYLAQYREAMELASPKLVGKRYMLPELREVPVERINAAGMKLKDSRVREQYGVTVVRILRRSGERILNPGADAIVQDG